MVPMEKARGCLEEAEHILREVEKKYKLMTEAVDNLFQLDQLATLIEPTRCLQLIGTIQTTKSSSYYQESVFLPKVPEANIIQGKRLKG